MEELALRLIGEPIEVRYARGLRDTAGHEAHAATYLRKRLIVLDKELASKPQEHARILAHELLHFAWMRLGNGKRREWEDLLGASTRGEAGWSAEWRKQALSKPDRERRSRRWREYICEAFCDTGAALWSGNSCEVTLAESHMARRSRWFQALPPMPV